MYLNGRFNQLGITIVMCPLQPGTSKVSKLFSASSLIFGLARTPHFRSEGAKVTGSGPSACDDTFKVMSGGNMADPQGKQLLPKVKSPCLREAPLLVNPAISLQN